MSFFSNLGISSLIGGALFCDPAIGTAIMASRTHQASDAQEADHMAAECREAQKAVEQINEDENEYIIDLDTENNELKKFQSEQEEKIKALYAEIQELEAKRESGNLTEDEKEKLDKELDEKYEGLNSFGKTVDDKIDSKNKELAEKNKSFMSEHTEDIKEYQRLADDARRDGTKLADTHVSGGVFKKLFGTTGADEKEAGDRLLEAGNNLQTALDEHNAMQKHIKESNIVEVAEDVKEAETAQETSDSTDTAEKEKEPVNIFKIGH